MIEHLLKMSLTGMMVILAVLALRLCLRRAPKIFSYSLWLIVLFRLLCPVSVALPVSVFNLFPEAQTGVEDQLSERMHPGNDQAVLSEYISPEAADTIDHAVREDAAITGPTFAAADRDWHGIVFCIWLCGVCGMLIYAAVNFLQLHRTLKNASLDKDNIYLLEGISSPFVAGIVRPRIFLPYGLGENERTYILLHEQTHIRRGDPLFRVLAFAALTLHWFNPLVWLAFFLSGRDMEMSCDERVLRELGMQIRCDYSNSLLAMAQGKHFVAFTPLAFGEGDTGKRIKNVLRYKKATIQVVMIGALVVVLACVALGADPVKGTPKQSPSDSNGVADDQKMSQQKTDPAAKQTGTQPEVKEDELTMELFYRIIGQGELKTYDFRSFENGTLDMMGDESLDYYLEFSYTNEHGDFTLALSYWKENDVLNRVYLTRAWDGEMLMIYNSDPGFGHTIPTSREEIEAFLSADFDILNEISFDLPKELSMDDYRADVGIEGGRLILPYVNAGGDSAPPEWLASGMVSRYNQDVLEWVRWENGVIIDAAIPYNHSGFKKEKSLTDLEYPAIIVSGTHDLCTPPEMLEMEAKGIDYEPLGEYWYLFIAREGDTYGYVISLTKKQFRLDDMEQLARSVKLYDPQTAAKPQETESADQKEAESADQAQAQTATIPVRTVSRSARCIDRYVAPDEAWEDAYGSELFFAEDCKFYINNSRNTMNPEEVTFSEFAEAVEAGDPLQNKLCVVEIHNADRLIHEITLVSARYRYGVSYVPLVYNDVDSFHRIMAEYDAKQFKKQELIRTETMDLAAAGGDETMEIHYYKDRKDGCELGLVHFFDSAKKPLYSFAADNTGMCWKNIYVGRMDGAGDPYILELYLENRDTSGEYYYYVYTLGYGNDERIQIAGSRIEWNKDGGLIYDPDEMMIFFHDLEHYLADSHLLVGMEDGKIRTQPVCDEDRYTYENCAPTCFSTGAQEIP